ncbi:MAG: hypothetical protein M3N98_00945 [Actinomycetota bacterium]|nr:hypothetical protein [Actinomycetota bacterium]
MARLQGRTVLAGLIAALLVAAVVGIAIHHPARRHPSAGGATTTTTLRPGPNGFATLSEPVDLLTLAVPVDWTVAPTAPLVLPKVLDQLAVVDPQLAPLLKAESMAANEGAVRLFAYTTTPSTVYAAILSYSSPGTPAITEASAAGFSSFNRHTATVSIEFSTVQLPAGLGLRVRSVSTDRGVRVAYENLAVLNAGRTVLLQLAADVTSLAIPPIFAQIESSLRFS